MPKIFSKELIKKLVPQKHHLSYENEKDGEQTVWLLRGEHFLVTRLDRKFRYSKHKPFTEGFLKALAWFYHKYGDKAIKLEDYIDQ